MGTRKDASSFTVGKKGAPQRVLVVGRLVSFTWWGVG